MSALIISAIVLVCFKADNEIVSLIAMNVLMAWGLLKLMSKKGY